MKFFFRIILKYDMLQAYSIIKMVKKKNEILQNDHKHVLQDSYFLYCDTEDIRLVFITASICIS